jgi:Na+/proline symporter
MEDFPGRRMILSLEIWLLPAVAAGSSSYLVSLAWERIRASGAPTGLVAGFLASLSFVMGAICSLYRTSSRAASLENNVIIMFAVGASTTFFWLLFLGKRGRNRGDR